MLASTSGGALFSRPRMYSLLFCWLLSRRRSVFCLLNEKQKTTVCNRHHHAALVSNPIPRSPLWGGGVQNFTTRRRVTENSVVSSSRRRRPALVLSLCLSLSLWRVRPRNVRCLPEENKRWLTLLFFSLQSIMNSDDGNVIDDQQHRRCCCFLGEVVLQKKSSKCNDE